jgi:hypothetical protein
MMLRRRRRSLLLQPQGFVGIITMKYEDGSNMAYEDDIQMGYET